MAAMRLFPSTHKTGACRSSRYAIGFVRQKSAR
jgi:hypothetical protein